MIELAQKIYNIDIYEARDNDETPESIAEMIENDPVSIIRYLVDVIEEMQEDAL